MEDRAAERCTDETVRAVGLVMKTNFERNQARLTEINRLIDSPLLPIPEMEMVPVLTILNVIQLKASLTVLGAAHSLLTITLCRGWYQKS